MFNTVGPCMTTRKAIVFTLWAFGGKVIYMLFKILSRLVITLLPRSEHLLILWLQSPSAVILEPKKKSLTVPIVSLSVCHEQWEWMPWSSFFECWISSQLFHYTLTFIKELFSTSSLSVIRVVSTAYLRLLIFLPVNLIPACASSRPMFLMMYFAYKLNKQGDNIQLWHTPFLMWNLSVVPCPVLIDASWPAYRFLRRQVRWSGIPISYFPQFVVIHIDKGFSIVSETEVSDFLEFSCFLYDPVNVGNLVTGSSAFWKPSLSISKFSTQVWLKPSVKDNLTSIGTECSCVVIWTFFSTHFLGNWDEDWSFPVLWPLPSFPNLLTYWVQHLNSVIF